MSEYPNLFKPLKINGFTYRNRIVCAPMGSGSMFQNDEAIPALSRRIEGWARGGAAAVNLGEICVNFSDALRMPYEPIDYTKHSGRDFDVLGNFASLIKKHGAASLIEIHHPGREKTPVPGTPNPRGPVGYVRDDGVTVEAMDEAMMDKACEEFATAAAFMQAAGFDGVLTHSGHGWLFSQFLSPLMNTRTDEYGGSLENRARFPIQILKRIRERVGPDFIIEARLSGRDGVPGGIEADEVGQFCKMLEEIVDSAHISVGMYKNPALTNEFSSMFTEHGCNAGLSATVKKYTSLPVGVVGGINSPELAEKIIAEGKADFVLLARQMIADPEFANKAQSGREAEIRGCLRCYKCFPDTMRKGFDNPPRRIRHFACSINPVPGLDTAPEDMPKPEGSRHVLVVGGGAAGMQAAITAAERGHRVTLAEKRGRLGGILNFTDVDVDKTDLRNFKDLLVREVNRLNVNVRLNTEITPDAIKEIKPEAVILALGSSRLTPAIPGIGNALHALDVYDNASKIGQRVVMVGGGLVGCETGLHLAKTGHEVTVIEMLDSLAEESFGMYREALMAEMEKCKVTGKTKTRCIEITPGGVKVEDESGKGFIEADTVVYALGMQANSTAGFLDAAGGIPVYEAGDCVRAATVAEAIEEGFLAAMKIL